MDNIAEHRKQKALAIIENTIDTATAITQTLKKLPKRKKRFYGDKLRRPARKKKIAAVMAMAAFQMYMAAVRNQVILSKPIPKYPK
jgi:hypothetical protein